MVYRAIALGISGAGPLPPALPTSLPLHWEEVLAGPAVSQTRHIHIRLALFYQTCAQHLFCYSSQGGNFCLFYSQLYMPRVQGGTLPIVSAP